MSSGLGKSSSLGKSRSIAVFGTAPHPLSGLSLLQAPQEPQTIASPDCCIACFSLLQLALAYFSCWLHLLASVCFSLLISLPHIFKIPTLHRVSKFHGNFMFVRIQNGTKQCCEVTQIDCSQQQQQKHALNL